MSGPQIVMALTLALIVISGLMSHGKQIRACVIDSVMAAAFLFLVLDAAGFWERHSAAPSAPTQPAVEVSRE